MRQCAGILLMLNLFLIASVSVATAAATKKPNILISDVSESKNRATDMPDEVKELKSMWDKWNAEQAPPSFPKEKPAATKPANRPNKEKRQNKRRNAEAKAAQS